MEAMLPAATSIHHPVDDPGLGQKRADAEGYGNEVATP